MLDRLLASLALTATRIFVGVLVVVLVASAVVSAQEVPIPGSAKAIPADHVPSWVLYWAIVIAGILGGGLVYAIKYLYTSLTTATAAAVTAATAASVALSAEQKAHRESVERLKQESADFGREAVKQLAVSTEAIEDLTAVTNQLLTEIHKGKGA